MLPSINTTIQGGNLGRVQELADGVAAIVVSGVAIPDLLSLAQVYKINGLRDAADLGIDAQYDIDNGTNAFKHIEDFYSLVGEGADLWLMVVSEATTLVDSVAKYIDFKVATAGRLRLFGVTRAPGAGYTPTLSGGLDDDVQAAIAAAKVAALSASDLFEPCHFFIEGRSVDSANLATITNQRATNNLAGSKYVQVVLGNDVSGDDAFVGLVLGVASRAKVSQSLGRVRSGSLGILSAFIGTVSLEEIAEATLGSLYDKGYIIPRKLPGREGFYLAGSPNCDSPTSDFAFLEDARTIEKARLIAVGVLTEDINENIPVDADGQIKPGAAASIAGRIDNALKIALIDSGEVSAARAIINRAQNILSTSTLEVSIEVTPLGVARTIEVTISFNNPNA